MTVITPLRIMMLGGLCLPLTLFALDLTREAPENKNDAEVVFAYQGDAILTQVGIDAAFDKIPPGDRQVYIRDGEKVDRLVRSLMKNEVLALDAIENGLTNDPLVLERILQVAYRELAGIWMSRIKEMAPEADYEAMAREDYIANPRRYSTPEYLDVTQILISTRSREDEAALSLAEDVRQMALDAPESFTELVMTYSDDPAKTANQGRYQRMRPGQMVEPFEDAAYALPEPGAISSVVKTQYGYHIIRLDARYEPRLRDFEEVRAEAIAKMRDEHQSKYEANYIRGLLEEGIVLPEGSVEVMLKRHFGENLENAPQY